MLSAPRRAEPPEPAAAGADPTAVRPVVREPLTPPTPTLRAELEQVLGPAALSV